MSDGLVVGNGHIDGVRCLYEFAGKCSSAQVVYSGFMDLIGNAFLCLRRGISRRSGPVNHRFVFTLCWFCRCYFLSGGNDASCIVSLDPVAVAR